MEVMGNLREGWDSCVVEDGGSEWDDRRLYTNWVGDCAVWYAVGNCDPFAFGGDICLASKAEGGLSWAVSDICSNGLGGECRCNHYGGDNGNRGLGCDAADSSSGDEE